MNEDFKQIIDLIEQYEIITIFRHEHPDCDALGSQFGLKNWIKENYPKKEVYCMGYETSKQGSFPSSDLVDDSTISNSLAIVLDTANKERIDDKRCLSAKFLLKIDHHPNVDSYGNVNVVYPMYAATCEILANLFTSLGEEKYVISTLTATNLYKGLLTDTLCFQTTNTTSNTLLMASKLAKYELNLSEINRELFNKSYDEFQFATYLRSKVKVTDQKIAYVILTQDDLKRWNKTASEARNFISEIGNVIEFESWCIFTQRDDTDIYDGSLRSKHIAVNVIAANHNGGGHKNAAGVKNLTPEEINQILSEIKEAIS